MFREELARLAKVEERYRRLLARLLLALMATPVVFVAGTVLIWVLERGHRGDIRGLGDAAFFTGVQLLTVSSQIKNPLASGWSDLARKPRLSDASGPPVNDVGTSARSVGRSIAIVPVRRFAKSWNLLTLARSAVCALRRRLVGNPRNGSPHVPIATTRDEPSDRERAMMRG